MSGYSGLSLSDTVRQSAAIHPHWDAKQHMAFLIDEAGFTESEVIAASSDIVMLVIEIRSAS